MEVDDRDRRLLAALQRDATLTLAQLGAAAGLSQSSAWRRVQEFEAAGLIRGRVALLDPDRAGAGLCVYAHVSLTDHAEAEVRAFAALIAAHDEIQEAHAVAGADDYILKIRTRDVRSYERFLTGVLLRSPAVRAVNSSFSLREIKSSTALPL